MRDDVRAAYVPWVAELDDDPAPVRAAVAFLADAAPDIEPVLVAPDRFMASHDAVSEFPTRRRVVVTPKSLNSVRGSHGSPVLVYKPNLKELVIAMRHRGAQPIAVVEAGDVSWVAWAAEIGALNLLDNTVLTPPTRTAAQQKLFDAIDHVGNNGWADDPSRRDLRRMLNDLSDLGPANKDIDGQMVSLLSRSLPSSFYSPGRVKCAHSMNEPGKAAAAPPTSHPREEAAERPLPIRP